MLGTGANQTLQSIAWLIALVELILGLYVLTLNFRGLANRHIAIFLLITAVYTFGAGSMSGAANDAEARFPSILEAITSPAIPPLLLLNTLAIFHPQAFRSRWRRLLWLPRLAAALPILLTAIDLAFNTRLYYSGILPGDYQGGYVTYQQLASGVLSPFLFGLNFGLFSLLTLAFLGYFSLIRKATPADQRLLAVLLLVVSLLSSASGVLLDRLLLPPVPSILSSVLVLSVYLVAAFRSSGRESLSRLATQEATQFRGRLQARFTALVLVISIPLLAAMALFLTDAAQADLEQSAVVQLENISTNLTSNITNWLDYNYKALQNLANNPAIISMDPAQQRPMLQAMTASYPIMYLVSTTDLSGKNVARSDAEAPKDYSDRTWFQQAALGNPVTVQTVRGRTSGQPALVMSVPIRNAEDAIVGVLMFAADLDDITEQVRTSRIGEQGYAFVIDQQNQLVAHPEPSLTAEIVNLSSDPVVKLLRSGKLGAVRYVDNAGTAWRAYLNSLPNGWAVIVQQPERELFAPIRRFQVLAVAGTLLSAVLLAILAGSTISQGIRPVQLLTESARQVAAGQLDTQAPVISDDELGLLATTFNQMTRELKQLVGNLEQRVAERTQALERRAAQLQATIEISREAGTIRDLPRLLDRTVNMISERFGFYHVGIFLLDDPRISGDRSATYVVLRAASSEGGRRMLQRGHKLRIGQVGIVGYVAGSGQPRIALDVGQDAVFFNNPDLPLTRSEAALPLIIQDTVIGVLDIQSTEPGAFSRDDIDILSVLAGQIALAIENSRLLTESRQAYQELEALLGTQTRQNWREYLAARSFGYLLDRSGVRPLTKEQTSQLLQGGNGHQAAEVEPAAAEDAFTRHIAIMLRGQEIGTLILRRPREMGPWTHQEDEIIQKILDQAALALENARLLEQIQRRADQEETINQILARAQASLNLETVIKATVEEIGQALNVSRVQIRLHPEGSDVASQRPPAG